MARIEIVPAIGQFGRTSVAFSPDGRFAVSGTHAVKLWERASGRLIRTFYDPAGMSPLALSADGSCLATGGWRRGNLQLWDVSSGARLRLLADEFAGEPGLLEDIEVTPIAAAAFSPDGARILAGRRNLLHLWDVASGQLLLEEMVRSELNAVAFSPDGAHFLMASRTGLELRDAATGELVRALRADATGSGKWEAATAIAFAPDGARALSVKESTLSYWDLAKGEILHTVQGGCRAHQRGPRPRGPDGCRRARSPASSGPGRATPRRRPRPQLCGCGRAARSRISVWDTRCEHLIA